MRFEIFESADSLFETVSVLDNQDSVKYEFIRRGIEWGMYKDNVWVGGFTNKQEVMNYIGKTFI